VSLAGGTSRGLVLDLIRSRGPISRVALAEATGLTQATMSTVVRRLIDDGLIVETGRGESTGGKPPVMVDVNPSSRFAVGVHLGRESITYVVVDLTGAVLGRTRTVAPESTDPPDMIADIAEQIDRALEALDVRKESVLGVGIAAPGPLDLERGVVLHSAHLQTWLDVPLRPLLADATGLPVILENDANGAALGDFWNGRLAGAVSHASVYMGSGIGAGLLIDGIVFRGASSNAGELGRVIVTGPDGEPAALEDVADPAAVVRRARQLGEADRLGLGGPAVYDDFRTIALAAMRGDDGAARLIDESAQHLATGVLALASLIDVDSVSLTGPAFAIAGPTYVQVMRDRLDRYFASRVGHPVRVQLSADVVDSAATGAAALVLQTELAPRTMGLSTKA